jgi:hypothetical protein
MAWSYRKKIKIIPGVHLNLSKRGISTSIGIKGINLNFSSSGTRLNTDISGISPSSRIPSPSVPEPQPFYNRLSDNIFSADVHEITSQNMAGIKETILLAQQQKTELKTDLKKIKKALGFTKARKWASYIFLYGLVNRSIIQRLDQDISTQIEALKEARMIIGNSAVNIEILFDDPSRRKYEQLKNSFKNLSTSHKIWDITGAHFQDRVAARSSASTLVNRRDAGVGFRSLPIITSNYEAIYFQNVNGADLYLYPTFIMMYEDDSNFAIIGLDELNVTFSPVNFTETGIVPRDSQIIRKTWAKVNKNGTPDKRFKNNYQIPVVQYGRLSFSSDTGILEEYQISNFELAREFADALQEYKSLCRELA